MQARRALAQFQARRIPASPIDSVRARLMEGQVALAARDYPKAQAALREADRMGTCTICNMPMLARAYDLEGNADSAIAVFERFVNVNILLRQEVDGLYLPAVHKRLGELYEAKGEREKALQHYRIFIDLWKDADPQLQPRVRDARQRVTALTRGTDVRR